MKFLRFFGVFLTQKGTKKMVLISGETITKDKGSCDGLESGLRLSRKGLPLGFIFIDSSHHEIEFWVPDVRANSFGGS